MFIQLSYTPLLLNFLTQLSRSTPSLNSLTQLIPPNPTHSDRALSLTNSPANAGLRGNSRNPIHLLPPEVYRSTNTFLPTAVDDKKLLTNNKCFSVNMAPSTENSQSGETQRQIPLAPKPLKCIPIVGKGKYYPPEQTKLVATLEQCLGPVRRKIIKSKSKCLPSSTVFQTIKTR
eukprot:GHVN01022665.1.p1 GENE.GHVN01022665.1~~GHVN01022665.1.p1  ORF type:complete len:175 (+),score=31.58 GHVN01022665.1:144-668(+)